MIKGVPEGHPMPSINADYEELWRQEAEYEEELRLHREYLEDKFLDFKYDEKLNPFSLHTTEILEGLIYDAELEDTFEDLLDKFSEIVIEDFYKNNDI